MKVKELIEKLKEVDGDKTVYLDDTKISYDFTGFNVDDKGEVELYICAGDKPA